MAAGKAGAKDKPESEDKPESDDPYGDELRDRLKTTKTMLDMHRYDHAKALQDGEKPDPSTLKTIRKLELEAQNLAMFIEARDITREP